MKTGKFHPESCGYPGVFIRGIDALRWAEWLVATPERRAYYASYGMGDPTAEIIEVLLSCKV